MKAPNIVTENEVAPNRRLLAVLLGMVVFLYWSSLYLYMPTLPVVVKSRVNDIALVGTVLSMYGLWQLVSRLPVGIVSDWMGARRPFIILSLILVGSGALLMSRAEGFGGLAFGRALTGLGAATWVPLTVLFTSLFPPDQVIRATGILTVINTLGRMVSTAITGTLNQTGGYPLAFQLAAGAAGLSILLIAFYPEKRRPVQPPTMKSLLAIFSRRDVLGPALLSVLLHYVDWTATFSFTPILARQLGASDQMLSALASANLFVTFLGSLAISSLATRIQTRKLLLTGFALLVAGLVVAGFAPNLALVAVSQLTIGLAYGLIYPVLMGASIRRVADHERTIAMGLHQSVYSIGMFAGPSISGILARFVGIQPMFGITAGVVIILAIYGVNQLFGGESGAGFQPA